MRWTAVMLASLAAARGYELAGELRDNRGVDMTPAQIAEARRLAREWKPKSERTEAGRREP